MLAGVLASSIVNFVAFANDVPTDLHADSHALLQRNLVKSSSEKKIGELDNRTDGTPWWNDLTDMFRKSYKNQIPRWCHADQRIVKEDHCPAGRQWCLRAFQDIRSCWDEWEGIDKCKHAICYTTDDNEGMDSPLGRLCQAWMDSKLPSCAPGQPQSAQERCAKMKIVTCDIWPAVFIKAVADNSCHTPEMVSTYCDNFADALRYNGERLAPEECAIDDTFDGGTIAMPGETSEDSGIDTSDDDTPETTFVAKCSSYTCPETKVLKRDAASLTCAGRACDYSDRDTCCDDKATCDSYTCPNHFVLKWDARWRTCATAACGNADTNTCCNSKATCNTYRCPNTKVLKSNAASITCAGTHCTFRDDCDTCCDDKATCNTFTCPSTDELKWNARRITCAGSTCTDDDADTCCDPKVTDDGACRDDSTWRDSYGDGCNWYQRNAHWCGYQESAQACCACGGGSAALLQGGDVPSVNFELTEGMAAERTMLELEPAPEPEQRDFTQEQLQQRASPARAALTGTGAVIDADNAGQMDEALTSKCGSQCNW